MSASHAPDKKNSASILAALQKADHKELSQLLKKDKSVKLEDLKAIIPPAIDAFNKRCQKRLEIWHAIHSSPAYRYIPNRSPITENDFKKVLDQNNKRITDLLICFVLLLRNTTGDTNLHTLNDEMQKSSHELKKFLDVLRIYITSNEIVNSLNPIPVNVCDTSLLYLCPDTTFDSKEIKTVSIKEKVPMIEINEPTEDEKITIEEFKEYNTVQSINFLEEFTLPDGSRVSHHFYITYTISHPETSFERIGFKDSIDAHIKSQTRHFFDSHYKYDFTSHRPASELMFSMSSNGIDIRSITLLPDQSLRSSLKP